MLAVMVVVPVMKRSVTEKGGRVDVE